MTIHPPALTLVATQLARALATLDALCNDPAVVRQGHASQVRLASDPFPRVDVRRVGSSYLAELRRGTRRYAGASGATPEAAVDALLGEVGGLIVRTG